MGFLHKLGLPRVNSLSLFLPLPPSLFQAEFPSGVWKLTTSTYLPWLLRPTREGAQGRAPSPIQVGAGGPRRRCKFLVLELYWFST